MRLRVSKTVRVQRDRIVSLFCLVNLSTLQTSHASTTRTPTTHLPAVLALCFRAADGLNSGADESSEAACPSGGRRPRSAACIGSDGGVVARSSTTAQHTSNDFASTGERPTKQPHKRLLALLMRTRSRQANHSWRLGCVCGGWQAQDKARCGCGGDDCREQRRGCVHTSQCL